MSNNSNDTFNRPPAKVPKLSGISAKLVTAYGAWHDVTRHIPKMRRYSLGVKIDTLFADILELVALAQFSPVGDRPATIARAITKNDILKTMLYVLLELKGIEEKYFIALAERIEEIGRMLYGWKNQSLKQLSPVNRDLVNKQ